jgi:ParB/RepB/Spo0J family partition protein
MAVKAPAIEGVETHVVRTEEIHPSPANKRKYSDADVRELAATIKAVGLLQPIVLRPHPKKALQYEIVAGERRWRACKLLGVTVLATIRELSDDDAYEITIIENLQREDPTALELAAGIQTLIDRGRTLEEIATKLGRPAKWVAARARLSFLSKEWRDALEKADHWVGTWSETQLELIARFEADVQARIFKDLDGASWRHRAMSLKDLRETLAGYMMTLRAAPWKLEDADLCPPGACSVCLKRSAAQTDLFDDGTAAGKTDRCLDIQCWQRKHRAYVEARVKKTLADNPKAVRVVGYGTPIFPDNAKVKKDAKHIGNFVECKKGTPGALQAIVVDGNGAGHTKWLRKYTSAADTKKKDKGPKSLDEKRADLERRRIIRFVGIIADVLEGKPGDIIMVWPKGRPTIFEVVSLAIAFGQDAGDAVQGWTGYDKLATGKKHATIGMVTGMLCQQVEQRIAQGLREYSTGFQRGTPKVGYVAALRACRFFPIDSKAVRKRVEEEIPEPKSWTKPKVTPRRVKRPKPGKPKAKKAGKKKATKKRKS